MEFAPEIVLIDDDKIIHKMWKLHFSDSPSKLTCFSSVQEFLQKAENFPPTTQVFIDCHLGDGLRGEIESEKIYNRGFSEIHITTSANPNEIQSKSWIRSIQPKRIDQFS
ncbi:MAG: hypothetical protein CME65_03680 [Halobacteriovoraceae bacterium]|nr:hypothetical protein [Halobacteriovoraceae bacterium]